MICSALVALVLCSCTPNVSSDDYSRGVVVRTQRTIVWKESEISKNAARWARNATNSSHAHDGEPCPRIGAFAPERSPAVLPVARPGLARLAWFMSMSKPDDHVSATYVKFAKAATASARANAPSLSPYFIYTFLPHQDIEEPDDDLVAWLRAAGTRVLKWRLSFWNDIPDKVRTSKQGHINVGAFGRIDVPLIVATVLREELALRGLSSQYVLYTDTDVMFARDWPQHRDLFKCADCHRNWPSKKCCRVPVQDHEPEIFLAGTEVFAIWGLNSGVMYMNVANMLADRRALLEWGNAHNWDFIAYDQGMLETFYRQKQRHAESLARANASAVGSSMQPHAKGWHAWDSFDDGLYNARGFMKPLGYQPNVWHWHGFKPYDVECWVKLIEEGRFRLDSADTKEEIKATAKKGCRGLLNNRMALPQCSLAQYLALFANYERFLNIADSLVLDDALDASR